MSARDLATARLRARYYEAADTVFMDGSTPWEVDEAMVAFGFAMGPFEAQDIVGLDSPETTRIRPGVPHHPERRALPLVGRMLELGKLGRKTGAGWYRYPGGGGKVDDPIVADLALEESHFEGRTRTDYSEEEIRTRLLLALINEAGSILDDGLVSRAGEIDDISVTALGFPAHLGGLMRYLGTLDPRAVLRDLRALEAEDPIAWRPAALLLRREANAQT